MQIKITNIDTFNFIKGMLELVKHTGSAALCEEIDCVLEQMKNTPQHDQYGNILGDGEEPVDPCKITTANWLSIKDHYTDKEDYTVKCRTMYDNFFDDIGLEVDKVCFAAFELTQALKEDGFNYEWVHECVKWYDEHYQQLFED